MAGGQGWAPRKGGSGAEQRLFVALLRSTQGNDNIGSLKVNVEPNTTR